MYIICLVCVYICIYTRMYRRHCLAWINHHLWGLYFYKRIYIYYFFFLFFSPIKAARLRSGVRSNAGRSRTRREKREKRVHHSRHATSLLLVQAFDKVRAGLDGNRFSNGSGARDAETASIRIPRDGGRRRWSFCAAFEKNRRDESRTRNACFLPRFVVYDFIYDRWRVKPSESKLP